MDIRNLLTVKAANSQIFTMKNILTSVSLLFFPFPCGIQWTFLLLLLTFKIV